MWILWNEIWLKIRFPPNTFYPFSLISGGHSMICIVLDFINDEYNDVFYPWFQHLNNKQIKTNVNIKCKASSQYRWSKTTSTQICLLLFIQQAIMNILNVSVIWWRSRKTMSLDCSCKKQQLQVLRAMSIDTHTNIERVRKIEWFIFLICSGFIVIAFDTKTVHVCLYAYDSNWCWLLMTSKMSANKYAWEKKALQHIYLCEFYRSQRYNSQYIYNSLRIHMAYVCVCLFRLYIDEFRNESKCECDAIIQQHIHRKILGIGPDKHVGLKGWFSAGLDYLTECPITFFFSSFTKSFDRTSIVIVSCGVAV